MTDPLLAKELRSLVARLRPWTPARWSAACDPWGTRADLGRHLAQWLCDRAALLERTPPRAMPSLPEVLVADQIAVAGDDLVRAQPGPDVVEDAVAHVLVHRFDLLGEQPPASLGGEAALDRGREVCGRQS